ncbi:MAG: amidohydrolase [Bacteroidales bacterium]|nr:amidohydrolase [Bacteroidales bacterium]
MTKILKIGILLLLTLSISCNMNKEKADLLIKNGTIYSLNQNSEIVEAVVIKDGKILATGNSSELEKQFDFAETIDLKGAFVYPGFNDAHCHFYSYGYGLENRVDLTGTKSMEEIAEKLKDFSQIRELKVLEGRGWDQNLWKVKEWPDNRLLDSLFPEIPVILIRIDGHAALVNSKALEMASFTNNTKIDGGDLLLKDGQLTGVLIDNAVDEIVKIIPAANREQIEKSLIIAQKNCFAAGLSSITDAGLDAEIIQIIDSLQKAGQLKIRINAMLTPGKKNFEDFLYKGIYKTEKLSVRSVKLYADGALGSRGARLIEEYSDDAGNYGLFIKDDNYYREICKTALKNGYQVCTHAIGDSAVRKMLNIYSEFLKGKNDLRWRIEHSQIVANEDFQLFGKFSIVPSIQTTHATSDMYWAESRLGNERIKNAYAYKKLLQENEWLPNGTDFPIEEIYPLKTFFAAVFRKDYNGWPESGFMPENALTPEQAIKSITIWPAKAAFEEKEKGTIEKGKYADFTILDTDILKSDEEKTKTAKVIYTICNGEVVYKNN